MKIEYRDPIPIIFDLQDTEPEIRIDEEILHEKINEILKKSNDSDKKLFIESEYAGTIYELFTSLCNPDRNLRTIQIKHPRNAVNIDETIDRLYRILDIDKIELNSLVECVMNYDDKARHFIDMISKDEIIRDIGRIINEYNDGEIKNRAERENEFLQDICEEYLHAGKFEYLTTLQRRIIKSNQINALDFSNHENLENLKLITIEKYIEKFSDGEVIKFLEPVYDKKIAKGHIIVEQDTDDSKIRDYLSNSNVANYLAKKVLKRELTQKEIIAKIHMDTIEVTVPIVFKYNEMYVITKTKTKIAYNGLLEDIGSVDALIDVEDVSSYVVVRAEQDDDRQDISRAINTLDEDDKRKLYSIFKNVGYIEDNGFIPLDNELQTDTIPNKAYEGIVFESNIVDIAKEENMFSHITFQKYVEKMKDVLGVLDGVGLRYQSIPLDINRHQLVSI